jgi:serine/threonine protein phosphatase PrpC
MKTRTALAAQAMQGPSADRAAIVPAPDGSVVLVLADGASGVSGGAAAAQAVVDAVKAATEEGLDVRDASTWTGLLMGLEDGVDGETTAVILTVWEGGAAGASLGDSIAWRCDAAGLEDLTRKQPKQRLGQGGAPVGFSTSKPGTFLLASDGLWKYAAQPLIRAAALQPDLDRAAQALLQLARLPNGQTHDDVTVALCRLDP